VKSYLAMLIGLAIAAVGLVGLVSPPTFARLGGLLAESPAIYVVIIVQLVVALVLLTAAPASRSPVGLGIVGALALAEAVLLPLLGPGRARGIAEWWEAQSHANLRFWALIELSLGVAVALMASPRRRALRPAPVG
jgi:hypothetical protein